MSQLGTRISGWLGDENDIARGAFRSGRSGRFARHARPPAAQRRSAAVGLGCAHAHPRAFAALRSRVLEGITWKGFDKKYRTEFEGVGVLIISINLDEIT
ncbi:MAG: hypothetical protein AB9897_03955 [Anaerolineaceae bacterium]